MTKTKLGKAVLWVGLTIWIALAALLLAQSVQAQDIERPEPWRGYEFAQWRQGVYNNPSGNISHVYILKHHRSGACWIYIDGMRELGMAHAPKEVCE